MSATSDLLQLLFEVAQDLRTTRNIALASAVTLLYETILTFPDEYALIWMGPMGSGKILYLASRYPLLLKTILREVYNMGFGQSLNSFCAVMNYFDTWAIWLCSIPVQLILVLRTLAVWHKKTSVGVILAVAFLISNVSIFVCSVLLSKAYNFQANPILEPLLGCYSGLQNLKNTTPFTVPAFAGLMFFDSVVFALMSFKAIQNFRTAPMPLLTTLVRDGALYFGVIFVISIANLVISVSVPKKRIVLEGSLAPALACFMSIIATRIVLNLRKQPFGDTHGDTASPTPRSDVRFVDQGSYLDAFSSPRDKTCSSSITV